MRKFCLLIHRWLALPLGIFMSILCFTGFLLLVVKDVSALFGIDASEIAFNGYVKQMHRWLFMMPARRTVSGSRYRCRVVNVYGYSVANGRCCLVA